MQILQEFKEFLQRYQVLGLAVAFVIGLAATKLITAIVTDLIMPIVAVVIPGGEWRLAIWQVGPVKFPVGDFLGSALDFTIVALVVFTIVRFLMKEEKKPEKKAAKKK
jgi:large conductance mechanosensitive channel